MKNLKVVFLASVLGIFSLQIGIASIWNCKNQDGLNASLYYQAKPATSLKIAVEKVVIKFQESDSSTIQLNIPVGSIFNTTQDADAYIEKESGASLSYISYEADDKVSLPTSLLFPKYVVNYSGARNELLIIGLRTSTEYHFSNCKKL